MGPQDGLEDNLTMKINYQTKIFTRIHPSTHTFANSDILELKKKLKKRQKKLSLFSILFFLELLSENQRLLPMTNLPSKPQTVSKPKHFIRFYSVGVFYLLLLSCQPFFAQELCRLPN